MCKFVWETEEDDSEIGSLALVEASRCVYCPFFTEKGTVKFSKPGQAQASVLDSVVSTFNLDGHER